MITLRPSAERGHANHGWLDTHYSFSFSDYYDPRHMGFRDLRVINEDVVRAGRGFGMHPHRDMEIITYIVDGELSHRDSMGRGATIKRNDVQRMSAGTGVMHSEVNQSDSPVHLLQIWILPEAQRLAPGYEQKTFSAADKRGRLRLIAAHEGTDGAVTVRQDVRVYAGLFDGAERAEVAVPGARRVWLQVARGAISVDDTALADGDGAYATGPVQLTLHGGQDSEVLVFDLP